MTQKISELDLGMVAMQAQPPVSDVEAVLDAATVPSDCDDCVTVGAPTVNSKNVVVYADKISSVSFDETELIAFFDVTLCVAIIAEDGKSKTYQVVKRIGIDKQRIAAEAEKTIPITIVESQQKITEDKQRVETVKRARRLAGLD